MYRRARNIFVASLMALLCSACAGKQKAAVASSVCSNQTEASLACASTPSTVFDSNGRLWLAWAFKDQVFVHFSDNKGKSYSAPVAVNANPEPVSARGENRPKIAVDHAGRIFVSWTMKLKKRFSGHIRFSRSLDGGKTFSAPVTVNDHLEETSHRFESMAVNDNGDIFIAWLDKRDLLAAKKAGQPYNGAAVYYTWSDDHGQSFHRNLKITDSSCQCCRIAMAMDGDGLPVILWRHIFGDNIRDHALAKLKSNNKPGKVIRASVDQWHVEGCPHHGPSLSIDEQGSYHLAWFTGAASGAGLKYAYSRDKAKTFSIPLLFGRSDEQSGHPQVLSVGKKVFLLWRTYDGKQSQLKLMQSSDRGSSWSGAVVLHGTSADAGYPLLVSYGRQVYAAWHLPGSGYKIIHVAD